ncbi:MAG TPA: plastocyanin/azurin family copper-binding protein [Acidimicrobiales bacterium]|nr:plastocyanin/azurin family copper-binding protein [Acidimicrobiales bacterium]
MTAATTKRWARAALLSGTVVIGAACGDDDGPEVADGPAADGGAEVAISDFEFVPGDLTVAAGTTVTWSNEDQAPHSIQDDSDLGAEEGPDLARGDTFQLTYDEPGTYPYLCGIHNHMTATITVE